MSCKFTNVISKFSLSIMLMLIHRPGPFFVQQSKPIQVIDNGLAYVMF